MNRNSSSEKGLDFISINTHSYMNTKSEEEEIWSKGMIQMRVKEHNSNKTCFMSDADSRLMQDAS